MPISVFGLQRLASNSGRFHDLLEQAELVVGVEDGEARGEADQGGVATQHAGAEGVEGAEPEALDRLLQDGADALAHLAGGLVGEGDGEDLAGEGAVGEQDMGEAGGEHARLAGAGSGQHQHGAVDALDGLALLGVQADQVFGHGCWKLIVTPGI